MALSIHSGYDTGYLTRDAGDGTAATDYLAGAKSEPAGHWQGCGAAALGLSGQVDADVMRRLYHEDVGPDGQVLTRRQRNASYPAASGKLADRVQAEIDRQVAALGRFATPEEKRAIEIRERSKYRNNVPFYDYTFTAPKSVSVLWASLLKAASEAEDAGDEAEAERLAKRAEDVRGAVTRANDRMIKVAERESAFIRTGRHTRNTGEFRDAEGFAVASFPQHDNRDGDPNLHVHNAILNRAQRADGADGKWRALHAHPLFRDRLKYAALGERFLAQEIEKLGFRTVLRADGMALEVGGISDEAVDAFCDRTKDLRARARELAADYEARTGHAPGKRAWKEIKQQAALETRNRKTDKAHAPESQAPGWAGKTERRGAGKLSALHEAAEAYAAEHESSELPSEAERARAIRIAVAGVQRVNSTWSRAQLIFELGQVIRALPADTDPEEYFGGLADEALSGRAEGVNPVQIAPSPDLIEVERLGVRKDGTSIYRPPGEARYATAEHIDREQHLVDVARMPVRRLVGKDQAEEALAGTDLDYSQREACVGLLTSGRLISSLVAPPGTGKTHVTAAFAKAWTELTGGRVLGLTSSTNAARVMADEAREAGAPMETYNLAQFLGKIKDSDETRGHVPVHAGDALILDEATQISTDDLLRVVRIARECGARIVGTFDPMQLGAVDAGGIMPLIAARHGAHTLTEVRRFSNAWERDASLRLRAGDVTVMGEYDARGRVYHGTRDVVYADAVKLYLNGFLHGQESLLMATSNEVAAKLAGLVRERLVEFRLVSREGELALKDGNHAGQGDHVRARQNAQIDADGQSLANRDVLRIKALQDSAYGRLAVVERQTGPGEWSRPFLLPVAYLEEFGELAYAGNVHVAEGRTVERGQLVVDGNTNRAQILVGGTRAREKNTFHIVTGEADHAGPGEQQLAPWQAIIAQALQQDEPERTALETIQAAQTFATHSAHLLELSEAYWRLDVVPIIDAKVAERITPAEYQQYLKDPERPAFLQLLREHEIRGRSIDDSLDLITREPLTGLRSISAGLHGRLGKEQPPAAAGETTTWRERAAQDAPEAVQTAAEMLDARAAELGRQVAAEPPVWALEAWGVPPKDGALRADWERRAGTVASYRETAGITNPAQAIGPVPASQAQLAEAFRASVRALELKDDQALLKAMGRGDLESTVESYERASALAPPEVTAEVRDREAAYEEAQAGAHAASFNYDAEAHAQRVAEAKAYLEELGTLRVLDAARKEWAEAHAGEAEAARKAESELNRRDVASRGKPERGPEPEQEPEREAEGRPEPELDADAEAEAAPETQPEPQHEAEPEPAVDAEAEAEAEAGPEPEVDTEAEAPKHESEAEFQERLHRMVFEAEEEPEAEAGESNPSAAEPISPERTRFLDDMARIHEAADAVEAQVEHMPDQDAERRAEVEAAGINEPVVHEPQVEAELESAWQPGEQGGRHEAEAEKEVEAEL